MMADLQLRDVDPSNFWGGLPFQIPTTQMRPRILEDLTHKMEGPPSKKQVKENIRLASKEQEKW